MSNSVSLATYSATYKIEGREYTETKLSVMSFPYTIDKKLVLQRMEESDKEYPDEFINIAYQILLKHKDAYDIKVTKQMDPLLTAMIVLLFLVFVFFGPIILAILMIGKPKKITPFRNVLNIEQYKKFRLIYLIIGFILYVGIIVLFILSIVIKSMSGMITPSLYILFGFDIVYLILSLIIGNSIYKKYHVEEPLPDGGEIIADPLKLESENEVTKAEETAEADNVSSGKEKIHFTVNEKTGFQWIWSIIALLAGTFLLVWWSTGADFIASSGIKPSLTFFESISNGLCLLLLIFHIVSVVSILVYLIVLYAKKELINIRLILSIVSIFSALFSLVFLFVLKSSINSSIDYWFPSQALITGLIAFAVIALCSLFKLLVELKAKKLYK